MTHQVLLYIPHQTVGRQCDDKMTSFNSGVIELEHITAIVHDMEENEGIITHAKFKMIVKVLL